MARNKGRPEDSQHRADRKARKRAKKGAAPGCAPVLGLPLLIPGNRTSQEQLRQSRRRLVAEKKASPLRFHPEALKQVQLLFHGEWIHPVMSDRLDAGLILDQPGSPCLDEYRPPL